MPSPRLSLPSLNALYTFEAVGRRSSFARASEELNVTPAAVSRMVARLEDHLGVAVCTREAGGVQLTEEGAILHRATSHGLNAIAAAIEEIESRRRGVDTVSISLSTGFTTHWLMPRMSRFKERFPHVELRFQLIMGALSGPVSDVDFGMRFVDGADDRHEAAFVMPEILVPICSPGFAARGATVDLPPFDSWQPVAPAEPQQGWSHLFFAAGEGEAPKTQLFFSDYAIVVQAAMLGQGVALGWLNVVAYWLCSGALVPAMPAHRATGRRCHFINRRDRPLSQIATAVRNWMIDEVRADAKAVVETFPELGIEPF
ncbi:LysR substrate-binding domain-containing protein [Paracoccus sp. MBLB3053]|uniref:LysR substrate-binding domain-containing protein n=1 Tax=Paracoccus aurantius TaxID=3073814 RepID=A0ABU2HY08_9RHOB|nr:LysR substrate-binding domain-containing protein [Paracoccus sp. MBLB3053]MDS9469949.1 LysR substrate-binding domain-containing protein [Paracoccus sp. MBLB3053]